MAESVLHVRFPTVSLCASCSFDWLTLDVKAISKPVGAAASTDSLSTRILRALAQCERSVLTVVVG